MQDFDYEVRPKRLTPSQRDAQENREGARYDAIYAEIYDMEEAAWSIEFPYRPFEPSGARIHQRVMQRLRVEQE